MKPYFETELGKLYHGDCLEIMPELEAVDLVITSPPYNLSGGECGSHKGHDKSIYSKNTIHEGYATHADNLPYDEYEAWQRSVLKSAWNSLSEKGGIFYNHKPRPMNKTLWTPLCLNPGLPLRQLIIWDRGGCINFSPSHYAPACEWILLIAKERFALKDRSASKASDVWRLSIDTGIDHPAPFPVKLPMKILQSVHDGITLDPHMGSGTTAIACERLKRRWIGIEISEEYCEIAAKRIERETSQLKLF